jgi:isopenicillin-N epimerase
LQPKVHLPSPSQYINRWPLLKQDVVYLDHGAFGGCPKDTMDRHNEIRNKIESDPHDFYERHYTSTLQRSKEALASFLHADVRGLVLLPGATHALNVVIKSQMFNPGDEILTTNQAYSSCYSVMDHVAERDGVKLVIAELPFPATSPQQVLESILACVTERTRFAVIDHIPSRTAMILPIKEIVAELESRGIITLVDGAHAPGMIELDVGNINAAYYVGNCHKWMCAPRGIGFLHVREDYCETAKPLVVARSAHAAEATVHSTLEHTFDWLGTNDASAYLSLPAAIEFLSSVVPGGHRGLIQRNHDLAIEARNLVCSRLGIAPPLPDDMVGSMISIPLPDSIEPPTIGHLPLQLLLWEKYRIEIPIYAWPAHPKRVLRFSVQAHNSLEQYAWLAEILRGALDDERVLNEKTKPVSNGTNGF